MISVMIKVVIILLAITGNVELWMAVLSDISSLFFVLMNGLRVINYYGFVCS
jgi:cation transport ATPase